MLYHLTQWYFWGPLVVSFVLTSMFTIPSRRFALALWEWLCMACFALPMMIVGYVLCWMYNGFSTGRMLYNTIHKARTTK